MRVAYFIGSLNRGGAETQLLDVFQRCGHLPFDAVCLYRKEGNLSEQFRRTGVPLLRVPRNKGWMSYCLLLRRIILDEHIGIIHAQTSLNAAISILITIKTNVKVVTTFHSLDFAGKKGLLPQIIFRGSQQVVFVSNYQRMCYLQHLSKQACKKTVVVHNGINFDKLKIKPADSSLHHPVELCMVGNFGSGRNHLFVCQFLKRLKETGVSFHFSFIGARRESEKAVYEECVDYCEKEGLNDCVSFLGAREDVPALLLEMDAFVYASRHDTFGIAVVEAIASGVPTFVNDWGVLSEVTGNGRYATLYPTGDADTLVKQFSDFLSNHEQWQTKAHANALKVRDLFSIEKHINNLHQIYKQSQASEKV